MNSKHTVRFAAAIFLGIFVYLLPTPVGLTLASWKLFSIFLGTIALVMLGVFPMGAASLMGLTVALFTKCMDFPTAFSGFISPITWLILSSFFISFGFVHTGLGRRIALIFIAAFGRNCFGLAYGIALTELILAPGTPSSTARTGGIIYPVVESIARSFGSLPRHDSSRKIGAYLILCLFNFSVVTSAMFMTAMAANPFAAKLVEKTGVEVTWLSWAIYGLVPGLVNLIVIPLFLLKIAPPSIRDTKDAVIKAKEELKGLGPMQRQERLMGFGFILLMALWILGPLIDISAVLSALVGLTFLLVVGVFSWEQLLKLHSAFETFIWFGALLALAEGLSTSGFTAWFGQRVVDLMGGLPMLIGVGILFLVYFYSHYFFASCTAHAGAMLLPFLQGAMALGAPSLPTALAFLYASSLFGCLTHYGIGPAPILFGSGYVSLTEWWRVGLLMSFVHLGVWALVGALWWGALGIL